MRKYLVGILAWTISSYVFAGTEGMPSMPKIQEKQVHVVKQGDDFDEQKGFGDQESMTRMMNLMMVEGSGYEGMDMEGMKLADNNSPSGHSMAGMGHSDTNSTTSDFPYEIEAKPKADPKVGTNVIEFTIKERQKEAKGLKLKSQVFMASMDMGTEEPAVKEVSPGKYQVKAPFTMKGPWAVKLLFPNNKEKTFNFEVQSK